jgi:hypothetical protein
MLINGKCHCGNIAFTLGWEGEPPEIPARACGCSFCSGRHAELALEGAAERGLRL